MTIVGESKVYAKKSLRGFTIIELLVVIAIAVTMTALAMPGFQTFIRRNAVSNEVNQIVGSLQTARTLALTGNFTAGVCIAKPTSVGCAGGTSGRYDTGHAIFTWTGSAAEAVNIRGYIEEARNNRVQVLATAPAVNEVSFDRLGRLRTALPAGVSGVQFVACFEGVSTQTVAGVQIFISRSGRITNIPLAAGDSCAPDEARSSY